jgi:hypothetical protein
MFAVQTNRIRGAGSFGLVVKARSGVVPDRPLP